MLIRLSKNSFIRVYDNGQLGYITNQLTRHDRTYTESGADFLHQITRDAQNIEAIVENLEKIYDVTRTKLRNDFIDFALDLANHKFVVMGETISDLDSRDMDFSYAIENPKTLVEDYTQLTDEDLNKNTQDFLLQSC